MSVIIAAGVTDLHLPRIGWRAISGTIAASGEAEGFEASLAALPPTYNAWRPDAMPATWEVDAGAAVSVDYCGIGAHDIGTSEAAVIVEYWDGAAWEEVASTEPDSDAALLLLFPAVTAQRWRIRLTGSTAPRIGNIRFGAVTKLPRQSTFAPALPITESEQFTYNVNASATGEWLGRSVVANGLQFTVSVDFMPETFAASEWADFRRHCNEGDATFFIAPKPINYPREVAYAWPLQTVLAERTLPNKRVSRATEIQCGGYKRP